MARGAESVGGAADWAGPFPWRPAAGCESTHHGTTSDHQPQVWRARATLDQGCTSSPLHPPPKLARTGQRPGDGRQVARRPIGDGACFPRQGCGPRPSARQRQRLEPATSGEGRRPPSAGPDAPGRGLRGVGRARRHGAGAAAAAMRRQQPSPRQPALVRLVPRPRRGWLPPYTPTPMHTKDAHGGAAAGRARAAGKVSPAACPRPPTGANRPGLHARRDRQYCPDHSRSCSSPMRAPEGAQRVGKGSGVVVSLEWANDPLCNLHPNTPTGLACKTRSDCIPNANGYPTKRLRILRNKGTHLQTRTQTKQS